MLYTVGLNLSIMAILIYLIEFRKVTFGVSFFDVFGKNPLFIYLFSELFFVVLCYIPIHQQMNAFEWVSETVFQHLAPGSLGSLLTAIAYLLLCWLLGYVLHRKRIYVKI